MLELEVDNSLKSYYDKIFYNEKENQEKLFIKPNRQFKNIVQKLSHKNTKKALDLGYRSR